VIWVNGQPYLQTGRNCLLWGLARLGISTQKDSEPKWTRFGKDERRTSFRLRLGSHDKSEFVLATMLTLTCLFSLSMTSSGVRFGAPMPNQIVQPARTSDRARSMLVVGFVKSSMTRPCRLRKVERQLDCDRVLTSNNWGA
jgi:hypothetical protein